MAVVVHSGVLGMKWGIRRYQNPDGSLTDLGRKHYGVGPAREPGEKAVPPTGSARVKKAKQSTNNVDAAGDSQKNQEDKSMTKEDVIKSGDYATISKYAKQLNDSELNQALGRLELERRLSTYAPKQEKKEENVFKKAGKNLVDKTLMSVTNKAADSVGSLAGAAALAGGKTLVKKILRNDMSKYYQVFPEDKKKDAEKFINQIINRGDISDISKHRGSMSTDQLRTAVNRITLEKTLAKFLEDEAKR